MAFFDEHLGKDSQGQKGQRNCHDEVNSSDRSSAVEERK